jgi:hypothetical protein
MYVDVRIEEAADSRISTRQSNRGEPDGSQEKANKASEDCSNYHAARRTKQGSREEAGKAAEKRQARQ